MGSSTVTAALATEQAFTFDLNSDMHTAVVHNVTVGEPFFATGDENATTGFTWNVISDPDHECGPEDAITIDSTYVQNANPHGFMGVGGTRKFTFTPTATAVSGNTCKIGFTMGRHWEMPVGWGANPQRSFVVQI